jgi:hypothetical protein
MTKSRNWLITCLLVALALPMAANAFAQSHEGQPREDANVSAQAEEGQSRDVDGGQGQPEEDAAATAGQQVASNLTLVKTTVITENQTLTFTFNVVPGFAPTTLVCPSAHKAGCTIKVEVSAQIFGVSLDNFADIDVDVTGPGKAVEPHTFVSVYNGSPTNANTFQWMKTGIPAGSTQTVKIFFATDLPRGSASTGFRTATIQLYLN